VEVVKSAFQLVIDNIVPDDIKAFVYASKFKMVADEAGIKELLKARTPKREQLIKEKNYGPVEEFLLY